MIFEEYEEDENQYLKDFEYTDEDIEAIMNNVKNTEYHEVLQDNINWEELELDRINYHISKQVHKGKLNNHKDKITEPDEEPLKPWYKIFRARR